MKTTLSLVRTNHDAHPPSHQAKASHRQKSLCCSSETEIDLRDDIVTNASRYLGAMRSRQDEPAARSPSFAQLEQPGQQALSSTSVGISQWGGEIRIFTSGGTKQGRNNHWTRVLDLGRPGFMAGRGRVSRCCLPLEARGLESRSTIYGGEGRLRSWDPKVSSASTPDEKAARPLGSNERGREVAGPERPV